jgi:ketosteroid isomerase-like protein
MSMERRTRVGVLFLALILHPTVLQAQLMPGGRTVDVGRLRGDFYTQMVAKVTEVMDSLQGAWRTGGEMDLSELYAPQATLLQPGGPPLRGRDGVAAFSRATRPLTSGVRTGMQDLEACEGFAYLSGYYAIDPRTANRGSSNGRHFTVIQQEGGKWLIRAQLFVPDSASAAVPDLVASDLQDPLTNDQIRAGSRGQSRFAAFGDAQYVLMALRDAWKRGDARDAASFFSPEAWVQLPNESENRMGMLSLEDRLKEGMARFQEILSVELDFDRRDRLSFTFGRYHAQAREGPDRAGHFFMLLKNAGNGWLIRSLVFS